MFSFLIGSRKFLMVLFFLVTAVYLLVTKQVPAADWLDNMSKVMISFLGANILEKMGDVAGTYLDGKKFADVAQIIKKD
jgi:uncharacterized membrane protein